jgi:S-adenosylmethionine:tRNA ribosyltransferase-isomerase
MGLKTYMFPEITMEAMGIYQWDVYETPLTSVSCSAADSLGSLLKWMQKNNFERIISKTQILIAPGYRFKIAKAIVTNFHQPQSTLLLLVGAAIGNEWRKIYNYALENEFRFLSYGDGNLLFIENAAG